MMLQADGTPFYWFEDGNKYSIHGFVDDATGKITGLYMCKNECLLGYLEVLRQTLENGEKDKKTKSQDVIIHWNF